MNKLACCVPVVSVVVTLAFSSLAHAEPPAAHAARATSCPRGNASSEFAQRAFPDDKPSHVRCMPVRADIPLVLVTFDLPGDLHAGALVSDGKIVWIGSPGSHCTPCMMTLSLGTADLDGDGRDELLVRIFKEGHMGYTSSWIDVYRIAADGQPAESAIGGIALGGSGPKPPWKCTATDRVINCGAGANSSRWSASSRAFRRAVMSARPVVTSTAGKPTAWSR